MTTTTAAAIRDRAITVIGAIVPTSLSRDRLVAYRDEDAADFQAWVADNTEGSFRRFQCRLTGDQDPPVVSDAITEELLVRMRITVAYPQDGRAGKNDARDRDRVIDEDATAIERAIGLYGKANFTPPYPEACWRPDPRPVRQVLRASACDFLVIEQTMSYYRATDGFVMATPNNIVTLANGTGADQVIGTIVYSVGGGSFGLAKADAVGTATVVGLLSAPIASGSRGPVQVADVITLTAAQWDVICGTSGGLTYNTTYYLSAATAGRGTATAPDTAGQFVTVCIQALSSTQATVSVEPAVPL